MHTIKKTLVALCCLALTATAALAVDYSKMTTDELSGMRGPAMRNLSQADWDAFHTEWWKRLSQMSPEERSKYAGPCYGNRGRGMGKGRGMGCGPCWGQGPANAPQAQ